MERLLLLADFSITLNGVFNPTVTTSSHAVLKTVGSTSVARTVSITVSGQSLPNECLFTDYALTRGDDGSLTWTAPGVLSDGRSEEHTSELQSLMRISYAVFC